MEAVAKDNKVKLSHEAYAEYLRRLQEMAPQLMLPLLEAMSGNLPDPAPHQS